MAARHHSVAARSATAARLRRVRSGWLIAGFGALLAVAQAAHAQPATPPTLQQPAPDAQKPTSPSLPPSGDNLSEKLDRSNGVIAPPGGG